MIPTAEELTRWHRESKEPLVATLPDRNELALIAWQLLIPRSQSPGSAARSAFWYADAFLAESRGELEGEGDD